MPLWEICTLDVHRQVERIGITWAKELPIWSSVDEEKLAFENTIGALKDVGVMLIDILSLILVISQLFKRVSVAQKVFNQWGYLRFGIIFNFY